MKLKQLLSLLLVTLLLFCAGCGDEGAHVTIQTTPSDTVTTTPNDTTSTQNNTAAPSSTQPLLFRVTDTAGHQAYLFGSIHVGRDSFYPLPAYVTNAFNQADKLAVEFDVLAFENDVTAQTTQMAKLLYMDGTTIRDHIDADLYNEAVAIMTEKGEYSPIIDYYSPAVWSSIIDNYTVPEGAQDLGIDVNLIQAAYDSNKPVEDVESADLQYSMMANYSAELQEFLLKSSVEGYKTTTPEAIDELMDMWASGDFDRFRAYLSSEGDIFESPEEQALYEEYNKAILTDRDLGMVAYVKQVLASGETVFVCVGASHVVGKNGIVDQLKTAGYTVEQVQG